MAKSPKPKTYADAEIAARLARDLPHWRVEGGHIARTYRTHGWKGTLMAANAIGHLAEAAWHHPEIALRYASVEVRLQSHDAGGITDKDFALAAMIEATVLWRPEGVSGAAAAYIRYD